jgi:hypothetical protein
MQADLIASAEPLEYCWCETLHRVRESGMD